MFVVVELPELVCSYLNSARTEALLISAKESLSIFLGRSKQIKPKMSCSDSLFVAFLKITTMMI